MPEPIKPKLSSPPLNTKQSNPQSNISKTQNIVEEIVNTINDLKGLQAYEIRKLVKHAEEFGPYLKQQRLETNQVRKFLDAINRLKADLAETGEFAKIETEVVLLKTIR